MLHKLRTKSPVCLYYSILWTVSTYLNTYLVVLTAVLVESPRLSILSVLIFISESNCLPSAYPSISIDNTHAIIQHSQSMKGRGINLLITTKKDMKKGTFKCLQKRRYNKGHWTKKVNAKFREYLRRQKTSTYHCFKK